jgi:hypothetical protein
VPADRHRDPTVGADEPVQRRAGVLKQPGVDLRADPLAQRGGLDLGADQLVGGGEADGAVAGSNSAATSSRSPSAQ